MLFSSHAFISVLRQTVRTWVQGIFKANQPPCNPEDYSCLNVGDRPLLENLRHGLIDPDTPKEAMTKTSLDGKELKLVVSRPCHTVKELSNRSSSRMNLTCLVEHFTTRMILSSKPSIFGMV